MPNCVCGKYSRLLKAIVVVAIPVLLGVYLLPPEVDPMEFPDFDKTGLRTKTAFVLGHTGGVGQQIARLLLDKRIFKNVVLIGRREVDFGSDPLYKDVIQRVVDFDKIEEHPQAFEGVDVGFCALGTTRAKAGKEGFIKVDHDYIVNSAKVAKAAGCQHFSLISSTGANPNSWFLYPKVKGETERDVEALGFPRVTIIRPGLLEGERAEPRLVERVAVCAFKPIKYFRPTALSVPMVTVAKAAIVDTFLKPEGGKTTEILDNAALHHRGAHFDKIFG
uniref:Protein HTATIP2 n=1 Tax=Plectus sambesii TaxID=2011161 RepID=A0A914WA45_9BILA